MEGKRSVLIVDDNEDLLETFSMILKRRGFDVGTASDGVAALVKFQESHFDVTLMDIVMPEMDGVEAFRRIREIDPDARVILMTAYSEQALIERALKEGAHCVVSKPLRIDRIIEMISEASLMGPVLLVDDDADLLETMAKALAKEGCEVVAADSGEEALMVSRERSCPIAFIDIKLPVMNGLETLLRLKEMNPGVTAIMMTGYQEEMRETIDGALAASAVTCLYKPFDPTKALDLVQQLGARPRGAGKKDDRKEQHLGC